MKLEISISDYGIDSDFKTKEVQIVHSDKYRIHLIDERGFYFENYYSKIELSMKDALLAAINGYFITRSNITEGKVKVQHAPTK